MLLKTDSNIVIDDIRINFDTDSLWMLNIALAVIMFGVALGIKVDDFKRLVKKPKILFVGILSQFLFLPIFTYILIILTNPHPSFALGMFMIAACPGGNTSNFYSKMANGNAALSVSLTAFATLVSLGMTPFNFHFWGSMYEPTNTILKTIALDPFELFKAVLLLLGIPLVLGMLFNYKFPDLAIKFEKVLKPFSMLVFIILIAIAFSKNLDLFVNLIYLVFFLVVFHNIGAYFVGYFAAKGFKLSQRDARTISIETGIQNGGLGLLLIFGFFSDLGGMAFLAAFWGVWDIFSGIVLALFWSHKPLKVNDSFV